jgi:hypothetical protein
MDASVAATWAIDFNSVNRTPLENCEQSARYSAEFSASVASVAVVAPSAGPALLVPVGAHERRAHRSRSEVVVRVETERSRERRHLGSEVAGG